MAIPSRILLLLAAVGLAATARAMDLDVLRAAAGPEADVLRLERQEGPVEGVGLPPRTVVRLALHPAPGSTIAIEVWLPDEARWDGRLVGLGNGGAAGSIPVRTLAGAFARGHALATTDLGTAPDASSGNGNPEVWKDFGHRATHLMTVAAKRLVRAAYGQDAHHAYFVGGSTGGQQAMQESQRHPEDYDGIVARVPAHCRAPLHAYFLWNRQILDRCPFSAGQRQAVQRAAIDHLAGRGPAVAAGRFVADPRCTPGDIEAVIALATAREPSLTPAHAEAIRGLLGGPRHAVTGERIFGGVPLGASWETATGHLYLFHWVFGARQDLGRIGFGSDIERYLATLGPDLNAEDDDLSAFRDRGGRLLIVSGSADAIVPYHATLDYYERLCERAGSRAAVTPFCRFFLIPGMGHAAGDSPGINTLPDLLQAVIAWREQGIAPDTLFCRRVVGGAVEFALEVPAYPGPGGGRGEGGGSERIAERFRRPPGL